MEVDLQSSSFRLLRSLPSATKRARSPDSFADRPSKRLSLAVHHPAIRQIRHPQSSENATPLSSACNSRFPSEDWVHQADALTIDSPGIVSEIEVNDEDINMDPDEVEAVQAQIHARAQVQVQERTHRPDLPPIQTTSLTRQQALPPHMRNANANANSNSTPATATSLPSSSSPMASVAPSGPIVRVLPPTPASHLHPLSPCFHMNNTVPPTRPSTPVSEGVSGSSSSNAMLLSSPVGSFILSPVSPRRQRFTMGPRVDCPKCQLGIKGHSVHY